MLFAVLFFVLAVVSLAFVCWPVLRRREGARGWILAASLACVVLGIGAGLYLFLGAPQIALRNPANVRSDDWKGMVALLVTNARAHPNDSTAWEMLGRGYLELQDGDSAAGAFRRALATAPPARQPYVLDEIGMSLTGSASGEVTQDAERAFTLALRMNGHDVPARFYLGFAYAARRDNAHAIAVWKSALEDVPANGPLHGKLVDNIMRLTAEQGQSPDIGAMVAGLAARLKQQPDDPEGWQRLVRSYAVLGDAAKARAALADARVAMKANAPARTALDQEAKELKLED
ncbi:MAG TPA: hypothetical protein VGF56_16105 [Rhizomicrobium sp.]|jgi:cytochrome c-type biogenesis protein CcmH